MARTFFRFQEAGIPFADMADFVSADGGDGYDEGLCVTDRISDTSFGGAAGQASDDYEVVVLTGNVICQIYDGFRIQPLAEVARFTYRRWLEMVESGEADDYEQW